MDGEHCRGVGDSIYKAHKPRQGHSSTIDTIVNELISSSLVKNLWCNIIQNCDVETSKECQCLCLENVVKLCFTVRCFSVAKDIVNKYKLSQGVHKKKAFQKDLKVASEVM